MFIRGLPVAVGYIYYGIFYPAAKQLSIHSSYRLYCIFIAAAQANNNRGVIGYLIKVSERIGTIVKAINHDKIHLIAFYFCARIATVLVDRKIFGFILCPCPGFGINDHF